jgi:hypothetical protein
MSYTNLSLGLAPTFNKEEKQRARMHSERLRVNAQAKRNGFDPPFPELEPRVSVDYPNLVSPPLPAQCNVIGQAAKAVADVVARPAAKAVADVVARPVSAPPHNTRHGAFAETGVIRGVVSLPALAAQAVADVIVAPAATAPTPAPLAATRNTDVPPPPVAQARDGNVRVFERAQLDPWVLGLLRPIGNAAKAVADVVAPIPPLRPLSTTTLVDDRSVAVAVAPAAAKKKTTGKPVCKPKSSERSKAKGKTRSLLRRQEARQGTGRAHCR